MRRVTEVLSYNLKRFRDEKRWKQPDLAAYSGLSLDTIKKIESETTFTTLESIRALAGALGVSETQLLMDPDRHLPTAGEALTVLAKIAGFTVEYKAIEKALPEFNLPKDIADGLARATPPDLEALRTFLAAAGLIRSASKAAK